MPAALDWKAKIREEPGPLDTPCWVWTGALKGERGRPTWGGRQAHRVVYAIVKGEPVPPILHHRCERPLCVNPDHMTGYASHSEHLKVEGHTAGRFPSGHQPWNAGRELFDGPAVVSGKQRRRLVEITCETCGQSALARADLHRRFCSVPCALVNARAARARR